MYKDIVKLKNIVKMSMAVVAIWLVAVAMSATFSSYVEPYNDENTYSIEADGYGQDGENFRLVVLMS